MTDRALLQLRSTQLLFREFGPGVAAQHAYAPGRVNLIGEHIDYHGLAVLPMAIGRGICVAFRSRADAEIRVVSEATPGAASFCLPVPENETIGPGAWSNYLLAAILVAQREFHITRGMDASVVADLPFAAGLSSSSALLIALLLALLAVNEASASLPELMAVLPEGEQFVGTRGGGMDHAAILASRAGFATHIQFVPFQATYVPVPREWTFVVAYSGEKAEKSAALRSEYNRRKQAGLQALEKLGLPSYSFAVETGAERLLPQLPESEERAAYTHVISESWRVAQAVVALRNDDLTNFGALLNDSHASLRDQLRVSTPALDALVTAACAAGAAGARVTGAGFGGCIVAACSKRKAQAVYDTLRLVHFAQVKEEDLRAQLFLAEPSAGALES